MLKNRKKSLAAITLAASVALGSAMLTSCSDSGHVRRSGRNEHYRISERALGPTARGSAGTLCGRTIVVSIFASDPVYKWDFDCEDRKSMLNIRDSLKMACDYLTDAAGSYGSKTWFESDFISNSDLMYTCSFDDVITTWDAVVDGNEEKVAQGVDAAHDENLDHRRHDLCQSLYRGVFCPQGSGRHRS